MPPSLAPPPASRLWGPCRPAVELAGGLIQCQDDSRLALGYYRSATSRRPTGGPGPLNRRHVGAVALTAALLLGACSSGSSPTASAPPSSTTTAAVTGAATAGTTKVNANTASMSELTAAFSAAGIANASGWGPRGDRVPSLSDRRSHVGQASSGPGQVQPGPGPSSPSSRCERRSTASPRASPVGVGRRRRHRSRAGPAAALGRHGPTPPLGRVGRARRRPHPLSPPPSRGPRHRNPGCAHRGRRYRRTRGRQPIRRRPVRRPLGHHVGRLPMVGRGFRRRRPIPRPGPRGVGPIRGMPLPLDRPHSSAVDDSASTTLATTRRR
ncbi:MAG: hypothetical protein QOF60_3215 [Actinomycetota bacterium]|nr:hypothetical protein [Actinomycetota bacterium]